MRANKAAATTSPSGYAISIGVAGTSVGGCATTCTAVAMAQNDVCNWKNTLHSQLPSGDGSIVVNSTGTGPGGDLTTVSVTVVWDDTRAINAFSSSSSSGSGSAAASSPQCGTGSGTAVTLILTPPTCPTTIPNCGMLTLETIL